MSEGKQAKKFERKPNREVFLQMSKDGRFCIVKVVESWILPRKYVQIVLESQDISPASDQVSASDTKPKTKGG